VNKSNLVNKFEYALVLSKSIYFLLHGVCSILERIFTGASSQSAEHKLAIQKKLDDIFVSNVKPKNVDSFALMSMMPIVYVCKVQGRIKMQTFNEQIHSDCIVFCIVFYV